MTVSCKNLISSPLPLIPFDINSIFNPNAQDDPAWPQSGFSILIYVKGVPYEFTKFYWSQSMTIEDNRGFEKGKAEFYLVDFDPDQSILPFIPLVEQRVEVWNLSRDVLFFAGVIQNLEPELIVRRDNGTEVLKYRVTATDVKDNLERVLIGESFQNVTTAFIAKVILKKYTFLDPSPIDATIGTVVGDFRINQRYAFQVIEKILDLEPDWTFWIDPTNGQCFLGEKADVLNTLPTVITEDNVYDLLDAQSLTLTPDTRLVRNRIKFFYNSLYAEGTVNVTTESNVVFGTNTNWTHSIKEGGKFTVNGNSAEYTVQKINNDGELILSSAYSEDIATNVNYSVSGSRMLEVVDDPVSISKMAQIRNEKGQFAGVFEYLVPPDGNFYTRDEAREIVKAELLKYSNPLIKGRATTSNAKLTIEPIRAGQILRFNLPISRQVKIDAIIQKITLRDLGPLLERDLDDPTDPRIDPMLSIDLDFEDRLFDRRMHIRRIMSDIRRTLISDSDLVDTSKIVLENIFVQDCFDLVPPIEKTDELKISDSLQIIPPVIFANELVVSDNINLSAPPTGPFFTSPANFPHKNGFCVGATKFGACS